MLVFLVLALLVSPAWSQTPAPASYAPPDAELWAQMKVAIAGVSMPLLAHQQVQAILAQTEQAAQARAKAEKKD